jgi:hypothetical protein
VSAWILGSEVAGSLGLRDFEFVQEYVVKGLSPHNEQGQPYIPAAVVEQFIQGLEQELNQHDELAWNLGGLERQEIIAKYIEPLQRRIYGYRVYMESLNGAGWNGFELPHDQDLARRFIQVLINSHYRRDEVKRRLSPQSEPATDQEPVRPAQIAEQVQAAAKQRKKRPEQRHREVCRAVAERLWRDNPEITISDMTISDEINEACEGKYYKDEKTIRNWIKDLCPNPKPGRPKKKSA